MGSISDALARAARDVGVDIRVNCPVEKIDSEQGRVRGVILADGERVSAKTVVGNANAQTIYLRLIAQQDLPPDFVLAVKRIRTESLVL